MTDSIMAEAYETDRRRAAVHRAERAAWKKYGHLLIAWTAIAVVILAALISVWFIGSWWPISLAVLLLGLPVSLWFEIHVIRARDEWNALFEFEQRI